MKSIVLLLLATTTILTSCITIDEDIYYSNENTLDQLITGYDLWYIDYDKTQGDGNVPFMSKAFTISFLNGKIYANNNIVNIGEKGNGLGVYIGYYDTFNITLETNHLLDGRYNFEVIQLSRNEIRIDCISQDVSYHLVGYQKNNFNYDMLFYDNIKYFLQEYTAWERVKLEGGMPNIFDKEHYLQFTSENNATFYSSKNELNTPIDIINWDFIGSYKVSDDDRNYKLKNLTLNYDNGDKETFKLTILDDQTIELYHLRYKTIYTYIGRKFVQYLKPNEKGKIGVSIKKQGKKHTKIKRK